MQTIEPTIISQYANSPTLLALIGKFNDCIDPAADIDRFYNLVWNVDTAQGYGLDVWGRIVGISRQLYIPNSAPYFGFYDGLNDYWPMGQAPFYNGTQAQSVFTLTDAQYRIVILAKALSNIVDCSANSINRVLNLLFSGRGRSYVLDVGNMTLRYVFEFTLQPFELAIVQNSGVIPRPAGVLAEILQVENPQFGFDEALPGAQPWNVGTFHL